MAKKPWSLNKSQWNIKPMKCFTNSTNFLLIVCNFYSWRCIINGPHASRQFLWNTVGFDFKISLSLLQIQLSSKIILIPPSVNWWESCGKYGCLSLIAVYLPYWRWYKSDGKSVSWWIRSVGEYRMKFSCSNWHFTVCFITPYRLGELALIHAWSQYFGLSTTLYDFLVL